MWTTEINLYIAFSFLVAGFVKGVVGLGFPTIVLAILSLQIGVRDAMALMLLPCFLTNVWQAFSGGNLKSILQRIWPLLLAAAIFIWLTTAIIKAVEPWLLALLLGLVLCIYAVMGLNTVQIFTPPRHERLLTPLVGIVNGCISGLTGTFVVPGVLYLQSLKMTKEVLVQAMGILFLVSTTALGAGFVSHSLIGEASIIISLLAVLPSFAGMALGRLVRKSLGESRFQNIFYLSLLLLGLYIVGNSFW